MHSFISISGTQDSRYWYFYKYNSIEGLYGYWCLFFISTLIHRLLFFICNRINSDGIFYFLFFGVLMNLVHWDLACKSFLLVIFVLLFVISIIILPIIHHLLLWCLDLRIIVDHPNFFICYQHFKLSILPCHRTVPNSVPWRIIFSRISRFLLGFIFISGF